MSRTHKTMVYVVFIGLGIVIPGILFDIFTVINGTGWVWEAAMTYGDFVVFLHDNLVITLYFLVITPLIKKLYSRFSNSISRKISVLLLVTPSALMALLVINTQLQDGIGNLFSFTIELSGIVGNIIILLWIPVLYFYLGKEKNEN